MADSGMPAKPPSFWLAVLAWGAQVYLPVWFVASAVTSFWFDVPRAMFVGLLVDLGVAIILLALVVTDP